MTLPQLSHERGLSIKPTAQRRCSGRRKRGLSPFVEGVQLTFLFFVGGGGGAGEKLLKD